MTPATVLVVLALVAPPLATDALEDGSRHPSTYLCESQGRYAPNSSYEANLRYLAATLLAEVSASFNSSADFLVDVVVGEPRDQTTASASCERRPGANSSDCAACLTKAFRYAQLLCPYCRHAMVDLRACRLSYYDANRTKENVAIIDAFERTSWWDYVLLFRTMLVFQVMGIACVLFMFLQEWRDNRRRRGAANLP